ncbi:MAG: glycoside hydrolase family 1 protein [Myxococcota bacterium]
MKTRFAAALLLACGCSDSDSSAGSESESEAEPESLAFPEGFLFGTSVAGFQVDMGCPTLAASVCEDPNSDWYAFATAKETVGSANAHLSGQHPSVGPGHWELYEQDLDRAAGELSGNSFRTSIEWSRVFPTATDDLDGYDALSEAADDDAIAHYHALFQAALDRGLTLLVTLNHYSLPLWIHDGVSCHVDLDTCSPRGWLDRERTVREIAKYAGFAAREFAAEVDLWATLNEPFAVMLPGYLMPSAERTNPPAVSLRIDEAKEVTLALIEAHARMYDAVKEADVEDADGDGDDARVGVVYPMVPVRPLDPDDPLDVQAAENVFYLYNMVYLNAVAKGELDDDFDGVAEHRDDLAGRMDYMGINYYTRITVEGTSASILPDFSPLLTFNPTTLQLWEDYPRGVYEMAMLVKDAFSLPSIVTENGAADPDDDGTAPSYLARHLTWIARAIRDGADMRGYFYWTLMDNYEWNHGMNIRMGLYAVDKDDPTKMRIARQAVDVYARIARAGAIPPEIAATYPAPEE